jgi:hypothetical protein
MKRFVAAVSACSLGMPTIVLAQSTFSGNAAAWVTQERWDKMLDSAAVETPKLLTTLVFLGLGWVIGKQLTVLWSRRQKQNEQPVKDAKRSAMALFSSLTGRKMSDLPLDTRIVIERRSSKIATLIYAHNSGRS